jgi:hypothetical protein
MFSLCTSLLKILSVGLYYWHIDIVAFCPFVTFIYLIAHFSHHPSCILCLCCLTSVLSLQCFWIVHGLSLVFSASVEEWHFFFTIFPSQSHHFLFPFISFLGGIKLFTHGMLLPKLIMVISFKTNVHYLDFAVESGVTHNNMSPAIYAFYTVCLRDLPLLLSESLYRKMTFSSWKNPVVLTF